MQEQIADNAYKKPVENLWLNILCANFSSGSSLYYNLDSVNKASVQDYNNA